MYQIGCRRSGETLGVGSAEPIQFSCSGNTVGKLPKAAFTYYIRERHDQVQLC